MEDDDEKEEEQTMFEIIGGHAVNTIDADGKAVTKQYVRGAFSTRDDDSYLPPEDPSFMTGSWAHDVYTGNVYSYDESAPAGSKWDLQICLKSD